MDVMEVDTEPFAILANYGNQGYARQRFDPVTLKNLIKNLKYVTKASDRTYIWRTFKDMIRNNDLPVADWYQLIMGNLRFETEE
jgi:aminopeptidase N